MWVAFAVQKLLTFFSAKKIRILYIESAKTVNEMTLNELVKLTTLWTTGPWPFLGGGSDIVFFFLFFFVVVVVVFSFFFFFFFCLFFCINLWPLAAELFLSHSVFWALFLHLICPIKLWEHLLWQAGAGHKVTRLGIFLESVTVRGRSLILSVLKFNWLWLWYFHEHLRYFVFISTTKILDCMEKLGVWICPT